MKKITLLIASLFTFTILLSGCETISEKSENYSEHSLKYLVNTTEFKEGDYFPTNELIKEIENRLKKFRVRDVEIIHSEDDYFITINFGTVDDVNEIKKWLELDSTFSIKKKVIDESDFETIMKNKAEDALTEVKNPENTFEIIAQNASMEDPERVFYSRSGWMYENEIKNAFIEPSFALEEGEVSEEVVYYNEAPFALAKPITIGSIIKLFGKRDNERIKKQDKEVLVSHILIGYQGALRADEEITRTKDEAATLANEVKEKLNSGQSFESLALEYSDDASNSTNGGELEVPAGQGTYVKEFEDAVLNDLAEVDQITEPFETPFGYHIVRAREITEASEETLIEEQVQFGVIFFAQKPKEWDPTEMKGNYVVASNILYGENYKPFIEVVLNQEGREMLHKLTEENDKEILGVFIGNELITSFTVKEVNGSGIITVKTPANTQEADTLKEKFDLKPLPAPIIFIEDLVEPVENNEQE